MKFEPFIIEQTFNAPVEKVWKAITDRDEMERWYFNLKEFKAEVGFEFRFYAGDDKKQWLHVCKVTEVIPRKKLSYSWRYEGYAGISYVTFELFVEVNKTKLKLTHSGLESFSPDEPGLKRESFVKGWTHIIGKKLKGFLERGNNEK